MAWDNTDNMPEADKPDAARPLMEQVAGENLPYRGMVDHGVAGPHVSSTDEEHYYSGRPVEYEPEEREPDPIPVKVVNQGEREITQVRTYRAVIPAGQRVQVLGRDLTRTSITIKNMDAAIPIYVGTREVGTVTGFPVSPGATQALTATGEVWAWNDSGAANSVEVALIITVATAVK